MKKNKILSALTSMKLIGFMQIIASVLITYLLIELNFIPMQYVVAVIGALVVLFAFLVILNVTGLKKAGNSRISKRSIFSKILSLLISIALVYTSTIIIEGDELIEDVTEADENIYVVDIVALVDSPIADLTGLTDKLVGVNYQNESTIITEALAHFEDESSVFTYEKFDDYITMTDAMYNGEIDAMVIANEYRVLLEEPYEHFDAETKVIATFTVSKQAEITTNPTNVTENPFVVYFTGIDMYGDISTVSRSDVNLVVVIHPKTKEILMVSIPRDTQVRVSSTGYLDKLTHAGTQGPAVTIATIENFLDQEINYYAKTNFSGMIDIVDALGGITVDSPYEFTTMHGNYEIVEGENDMDGDMALSFVRERYALPRGDFDRVINQQLALEAMITKASSPSVITRATGILQAVSGSFETDMSSEEIRSLLNMQLSDMASWNISHVSITGSGGETSTGAYITIPYTWSVDAAQELIERVMAGEKLTPEDTEGLQ